MVHHPRLTLGKMQNPVRGILHGSAAIGTVALLIRAENTTERIAFLIYGLGLIVLYTTSSLYHSVPWPDTWKMRMQRADHSAIFLLIAGSYTPLAAIGLDGRLRIVTLAVAWGITLGGISQLVFFPREKQHISVTLHVTLGWLGLLILAPLAHRLPIQAVILALAGGVAYTVGMILLMVERPRLWPRVFSHHEVFHVFVVAGSIIHYVMTWRYVAGFA
jgi:hemolysin III